MPTLKLKVGHGKKYTLVNFLVDSGSQRSYVSTSVVERLKGLNYKSNKSNIMVSTFLDAVTKEFFETSLAVCLNQASKDVPIPFLISEEVNLSYNIDYLSQAASNIQTRFPTGVLSIESNEVRLEG